ncbi:1-aminocyclopropane-1-carboxylate synthase 1 [Pyrus ussuriensis x Pyrus communis]|uniref:1-aminocyclopropane-1-carboxylate synthase 1 n=1 Tax=Pyrus ussuriensis x Pyrus communis TaxID=2448454 RepID=A0A5N5F476_9ROSA|nr:1-aminocyclopropane-1-carboxylate synthase 1 [Pyrus ussuriensis x Pyrus communis]
MASSASENRLLLSKIATNEKHGEDSPYFDGWKAYDQKPFHPTENPEVLSRWIWQKISFPSTWLKSGLRKIPKPLFALLKELRSSETWPIFKTTMAYQSSNRCGRVTFDPHRVVMSGGGATGANELVMFCLADPGDVFLIPSP